MHRRIAGAHAIVAQRGEHLVEAQEEVVRVGGQVVDQLVIVSRGWESRAPWIEDVYARYVRELGASPAVTLAAPVGEAGPVDMAAALTRAGARVSRFHDDGSDALEDLAALLLEDPREVILGAA